MVNLLSMICRLKHLSVKDAHTHVNFILIRKQIVGMLDVWVDVSHRVPHHVQLHALVHVLITMLIAASHIKPVRVEDAVLDVQ